MRKLFFSALLACTVFQIFYAQSNIVGSWSGVLKIQQVQLPIVFNIQLQDNKLSATLDSPSQKAFGIKCDNVVFENNQLIISINKLNAEYKGTLENDTIKGTFTQGIAIPLNLTKSTTVQAEPKRPQEPKPPFPYYTEEVKFINKTTGDTLAGTLTLPNKNAKCPIAILISGSGAQDRNEELLGHKPFLVIADYLARNGIGTLRYDDRGVGESKGNFHSATTFDFSTDAEAALGYLTTRKNIDVKHIGFIGHSEGGIIAPMVAARNSNVAFCVLLAGAGIRGDKLLLRQTNDISKAMETPDSIRMSEDQTNRKAFDIILNTKDIEKQKSKLAALIRENVQKMAQDAASEEVEKRQATILKQLTSPWFQYFVKYDPAPTLSKVKCRVLALNGERDLQVSPKENLTAIRKALEAGGNKNFRIVELPGLNHLFQECQTGVSSEYGSIEQTFSPKALETIAKWIKENKI